MSDYKNSELIQRIAIPLKRRRIALCLTLADLQKVLGISASTLSRIERGIGLPDVGNIATIANWLEIPAERIFRNDLRSVVNFDKSIPDLISEQLERDETLKPEAREFLSNFFRRTYQQFVKFEKARKSL